MKKNNQFTGLFSILTCFVENSAICTFVQICIQTPGVYNILWKNNKTGHLFFMLETLLFSNVIWALRNEKTPPFLNKIKKTLHKTSLLY